MRYLRIIALITALLLCLGPAAEAEDGPETIRVTMSHGGQAVPGGALRLYWVGAPRKDGYALTDAFSESGISLADTESPETALALASYALECALAYNEATVDVSGAASFHCPEPGLYLILQTDPAPGYASINPFLITVPDTQSAPIFAFPKLQPEDTTEPTEPGSPTSPKTGQDDLFRLCLAVAAFPISALGILLCLLWLRKKR